MNFHCSPNTFVNRIHLIVKDLQRSLQYYTEVIGFRILTQTEKTAHLTADGKTSLITLEQPDNVIRKPAKTTGLYHFALLLPDRVDLGGLIVHFNQQGVAFGHSDHLVSEAIYCTDPDGNGIELYADRAPSTWSWQDGRVTMTVDPLQIDDLIAIGKEKAWAGLPAATIMGHLHLHVSDLQSAGQFYTEGLGFDVVGKFGNQALFLSTGGYHHHIAFNVWQGVGAPAPPKSSTGLRSFELAFPDEATRARAIAELQRIGAVVTVTKTRVSTTDPAGNHIQLHVSNES